MKKLSPVTLIAAGPGAGFTTLLSVPSNAGYFVWIIESRQNLIGGLPSYQTQITAGSTLGSYDTGDSGIGGAQNWNLGRSDYRLGETLNSTLQVAETAPANADGGVLYAKNLNERMVLPSQTIQARNTSSPGFGNDYSVEFLYLEVYFGGQSDF